VIGRDQEFIDWLSAMIQAPDDGSAEANGHVRTDTGPSPISDEAIIEKCHAAENAAKFADLFDAGDVHTHHDGDDSRADLSLLAILAFYTQDEVQLERIFSSSALGQREKWRRRADYRERTVQKALTVVRDVYAWPKERRHLVSSSLTPPVQDDDDDTSW
jgi:primase-polymerase (primpol)-like protein